MKSVRHPKKLFLIDSLGALLTAFLLFVVVRNFNEYFGLPKIILTYISAIALLLSVYSISCFYFIKSNWTFFIRIIAYANILYCVLISILLLRHHSTLTVLGLTYFLIEIAIICGLAYMELNAAHVSEKV